MWCTRSSNSSRKTKGTFKVTNLQSGCPCFVSSNRDFVTTDSQCKSDGSVGFMVDANSSPLRRTATLSIDTHSDSNSSVTIVQEGKPCQLSFISPQSPAPAEGGNGVLTVIAASGCPWNPLAADEGPVHVGPPQPGCRLDGSGSGNLCYSVDPNSSSLKRTGSLTIGGRKVPIQQNGCSSVSPAGVRRFLVTASEGCQWDAESNVDFATITSPSSHRGSGSQFVEFSVAEPSSDGLVHYGTIAVAGQMVIVEQPGREPVIACASLTGAGEPFGPAGGIGSLAVNAARTCSWQLGTTATFLKLASASVSGAGSATVPFCVAANRDAQRGGLFAVSDSPTGRSFAPIFQNPPDGGDPTASCTDPSALCLHDDRFEVRATFDTPGLHNRSGQGVGVTRSKTTGYFWLFDKTNPELVVKVFDGRPLTHSFWVFTGALTNLPYVITVTDTATGKQAFLCNLNGSFQSFTDASTLTSN